MSQLETNHAVGIKAIVSSFKSAAESTIRTGELVVNLGTQVVFVDDQPVPLTGKEYAILELLSLRKGSVLTKDMFLDELYDGTDEPDAKIIDVFVCKLRKKLAHATGGSHYIETVWGRGYMLRDPAATAGTEPPCTNRSGCGQTDLRLQKRHVKSFSVMRRLAGR